MAKIHTEAIEQLYKAIVNIEKNMKNTGWICPKCGAVMSPFEKHCINCKGDFNTYTPTWI